MEQVRFADGTSCIHSNPAIVPATEVGTASGEIVFVDPGISDMQTILNGVKPGVQVVLLDGARDALDQIAYALAGCDYNTAHIVAHGAPGRLAFSSGALSVETLGLHAAGLARIGSGLAPGAQVLLWSCDVGRNAGGAAFVDALSAATGMDVAASTHRIGAANAESWSLDLSRVPLHSAAPVTQETMAAYQGVLVNVTPNLSDVVAFLTVLENAGPQIIDSDVTFTDPGNNFDGGTLAITGLLAEDRVSIQDEGSLAGQIGYNPGTGAVSYGGVQMGVAAGGSGSALTVTFNASATSAAIDALIQRLIYDDVSDTPAASRTFNIDVVNAAGAHIDLGGSLTYHSTGLLSGVGAGQDAPAVIDFDSDGDLDLFVGQYTGGVNWFRNDAGSFVDAGQVASVGGGYASPAVFNSGGTNYLIVANLNGATAAYTINANATLTSTANPTPGLVPYASHPTFADLDQDSDQDELYGQSDGHIYYNVNNGNGTWTVSTIAGITDRDFGSETSPVMIDFDRDGDLDILIMNSGGGAFAFRNDGGGTFVELAGTANPFASLGSGGRPIMAVADLNGDGFLDIVLGNNQNISLLQATPHYGVDIAVSVTPQDDVAAATPDAYSVAANSGLVVAAGSGLLANDPDPDGGPASTISGITVNGAGASLEQELTLTDGALLTVHADGSFSYDPNHAFDTLSNSGTGASDTTGTETFTYTIAGGTTATVTLTVDGIYSVHTIYNGSGTGDAITGGNLGNLFDLTAAGSGDGGADHATGGTGNDGFKMGSTYTAADLIDGAAGANDQIQFDGDYSGPATILSHTSIQNIEVLALAPGHTYNLQTDGTLTTSGQTFTFWSVSMTGPNFVSIAAQGETGNLNFYLGQGNDNVEAGSGNNLIYGEGGNDSLTGGAGKDIFAYLHPSDSDLVVDFDGIAHFAAGTDQFKLTGLPVSAVDSTIIGFADSTSSLETALADNFGSGKAHELAAGHAVIFHSTGFASFNDILVVNAHGAAGFSLGNDYVMALDGLTGTLTTGDFVV